MTAWPNTRLQPNKSLVRLADAINQRLGDMGIIRGRQLKQARPPPRTLAARP